LQDLFAMIPKDGSTVDLQPLLTDFVMDVVTHAFIGQSTDILSKEFKTDDRAEAQKFGDIHTLAQEGLVFDEYNIFKLVKVLFGNVERNRHATQANEMLAKMIERCSSPEALASGKTSPILEAAVREGRDTQQTLWDLMGLITAGKDTTSAVLGNMLFCLARNPEVLNELRGEIQSLEGRPPGLAELTRLKKLRNVLQESMYLNL
jgi:cytochrome P450